MKDFWRDKKVFITGANGFLESWISIALIDKGARVLALIKEDISGLLLNLCKSKIYSVTKGTITDYNYLKNILIKKLTMRKHLTHML